MSIAIKSILRETAIVLIIALGAYFLLAVYYDQSDVEVSIADESQIGQSLSKHPILANLAPSTGSTERIVVLVLDSNCRISQSQKEFHVNLLKETNLSEVTTVIFEAIRGDESTISEEFTEYSDYMFLVDPREFGVTKTPTILLLEELTITAKWVGQLNPQQQRSASRRILKGGHTVEPYGQAQVETLFDNESDLLKYLESNVLVDVQSRDTEASWSTRFGAKHIPLDELFVRSAVEIEPFKSVVIDCGRVPNSECMLAGKLLEYLGYTRILLLDSGVFSVACTASTFVPSSDLDTNVHSSDIDTKCSECGEGE